MPGLFDGAFGGGNGTGILPDWLGRSDQGSVAGLGLLNLPHRDGLARLPIDKLGAGDPDPFAAMAAGPGQGAMAMAPGLLDYLTKDAPPPSYEPNAAGKIPPIGYNPYEAGAAWDAFNLATMLTPSGAGKTAVLAAAPMAARAAKALVPLEEKGLLRAFHNSRHQFDNFAFRPSNKDEAAVFFSSDAEKNFGPYGYEVALRPKKMEDYRYRDYDADPIYDPAVMQKILAEARTSGADAAKITGIQNFEHGPQSTTYAVFDPALIEILKRY